MWMFSFFEEKLGRGMKFLEIEALDKLDEPGTLTANVKRMTAFAQERSVLCTHWKWVPFCGPHLNEFSWSKIMKFL